MGRSVSVPSDAIETVYLNPFEAEDDLSDAWDAFIDDLRGVIREKYPSFNDDDTWHGREEKRILENSHAYIIVAEYSSLVSVSIVAKDDYHNNTPNLAEAWCNRIAKSWRGHMVKRYPSSALQRLGTFSNGESVYQKIGK